LNKIANEGTPRKDKNILSKDLYSKCSRGGSTKISGTTAETLEDFIYELGIQSSEFVRVVTEVKLKHSATGLIDEIIVIRYDREDLE